MKLFGFAVATTVVTFLLLLVGGTVNPAGASLACPDWPTCYGTFFPEMEGGVAYEHTHRLVAALVGLMTIALASWIWITRRADAPLRWMAVTAVLLVLLQGVLGGVTVLLRLPLFVSTAHLALSMIFFLFLIYLCFRLWPGRAQAPGAHLTAGGTKPPRAIVLSAGVLTYLQILIGAFVRHTGAGRVCGVDWLWCRGEVWPELHAAQMQMTHRLFGYFLVAVVIYTAVVAARRARAAGRRLAYAAAIASPVIVAAQVVLGILTVATGINVWIATAHLGGGALLLADIGVLHMALAGRVREAAPATAPQRRPAEAT